MIRNETEYQHAVARIDAERRRFAEHAEAWKQQGFTPEQIAKLTEPLESFSEFENLHGLGQVLIGVRIARGMTQRELARRLGVDETMVSRDERNEYHGITVERAKRVLDALGVRLVTRVEVEPLAGDAAAAPKPEPAQ